MKTIFNVKTLDEVKQLGYNLDQDGKLWYIRKCGFPLEIYIQYLGRTGYIVHTYTDDPDLVFLKDEEGRANFRMPVIFTDIPQQHVDNLNEEFTKYINELSKKSKRDSNE
jgi:hypothetical protein